MLDNSANLARASTLSFIISVYMYNGFAKVINVSLAKKSQWLITYKSYALMSAYDL